MNRFYRKPKPETMKKNRDKYKEAYKDEIAWLKENIGKLTMNKNKFLVEMYTILISGSRKITPKMESSIINGITRCKKSPMYNDDLKGEAEDGLKPILSKINVVLAMAEGNGDYSVDFIKSVQSYVKKNYKITKKQMKGLNKIYKRLTEDLFNEGDKNE